MKITIETTQYEEGTKCSIESKTDDLDINDVFEQLIIPCLLGFGYSQEVIDKAFPEF